ncbi:hypothetical protein [Streptomyces sp. NPDC088180]|uniref:hypothetical protein n=1 Tax=Streptomyces sp. NPDC088180 TaxID=3365837 RepID=UPI00380D662E
MCATEARQANTLARDDRALAKEGQIADRYTAAVGNLGEDTMDVRLGGIYVLQWIMQDSRPDQPTDEIEVARQAAASISSALLRPNHLRRSGWAPLDPVITGTVRRSTHHRLMQAVPQRSALTDAVGPM